MRSPEIVQRAVPPARYSNAMSQENVEALRRLPDLQRESSRPRALAKRARERRVPHFRGAFGLSSRPNLPRKVKRPTSLRRCVAVSWRDSARRRYEARQR